MTTVEAKFTFTSEVVLDLWLFKIVRMRINDRPFRTFFVTRWFARAL